MNQPQDHKKKSGVVEVKGVSLTIPAERLSDWDIVEGVATLQDENADNAEKLVASVRVLRRLLGGDYQRVKKELREANGGELTAEDMSAFITEAFEALNPNS